MRWKKLGQIYYCNSKHEKLLSHASNPLAVYLSDNIYRIFYSGRNNENKSSVGYVDVDIITKKVLKESPGSIIDHGDTTSFYSHGISIGNSYSCNDKNFILFMAWKILPQEHWKGLIGRLELSRDKGFLSPQPESPYLDLDEEDPISLSYPWVMYDQGIYKMWYGSTVTWKADNNEMIHVIKFATSQNGEDWEKHGTAIPYKLGEYQAFSRPTIIKDSSGYHMWYSYRGAPPMKYRIGYSHSEDGIHWTNKHAETGIDVSSTGWDSEMICYPYVFDHKGQRYMLYNGNEYGKYGFGIAIQE